MKKINVYIIKQLLLGFVFMALGMTALIWLSQSLRMIDWIVNKGVSVNLFIELTLLVVPNFFAIITPLAFFIVVLFVYQRLISDRELVVMKAAGMSAFDLAKPAIYVGTILVILGYCLTLWLVPYSVSQFKELRFKIRNNLAQVVIQEGEFNPLSDKVTAYVRVFKPSGYLEGILIHDDRNPNKRVVMVAKEGLYLMGDGEARIVMQDGVRQEYNRKTGVFSSLSFEQNTITFEENKTSQVRTLSEEEQSLKRLLTARADDGKLTPLNYRKYKVEAFKRLTQPLYALAYAFIGLLTLLLGHYNRRGQSERIYLAVALVVLLQALALGFENLSDKNLWFLLLMAANFAMPIIGGFVILKRGYFIQGKNKITRWLTRFFVFALILFGSSVYAATPQFVVDTDLQTDAPVEFEADKVSYNQTDGTIVATGHVYINQNGTILKADKLLYNQKDKSGQAIGNVVVIRPDGVELHSSEMSLSDAFQQAEVKQIELLFADGSTFKAERVERTDGGNLSIFKKVSFTPCSYCSSESPLWDISASTVEHNYSEQEYIFYNAIFDLKSVPVFYWPYLVYPDFQVKRKTGFLAPTMTKSTEMGFGVETPFFWNISNSQDLYLNPIWAGSHFPLFRGNYRGIYHQSKLTGDFSMTQNKNDDEDKEGHILLNYENDLTDNLRFTGQYYRVSNHTYFRRYPIENVDDQAPWIQSFGNIEYFGEQTYAYAKVMDFQNLRDYVSNDSMPLVSKVNLNYVTKPLWKGLYGVSTINGADVYRKTGERSTRLSYTQQFLLPYISPTGFVFENQATGRVDGYLTRTDERTSNDASRFYTNVSTKASYPVMQSGESYSQVVEPIVMGVWSPNKKVKKDIPNEDSLDVVFDDVNLFSPNRYNGYDRVETGSRMNYGMKWSLYGPRNMFLSAMVGQSYRFREEQDDAIKDTGFDKHFSDYVGYMNMDFKDFGLGYRFRINQKTLKHETSETRFYVGRDPLRLNISYLYLKATQEAKFSNALKDREEIYFSLQSKITQNWSGFGFYRYDLARDTTPAAKRGGPIESGGGVQYDNECLAILFTAKKEFTKDKNYRGDTSFYLQFIFKTLGGV